MTAISGVTAGHCGADDSDTSHNPQPSTYQCNYPDSAAGERAGRPLAASSARMHHHHHWHSSPSRLPTAADSAGNALKKWGVFEKI